MEGYMTVTHSAVLLTQVASGAEFKFRRPKGCGGWTRRSATRRMGPLNGR